MVGKQASRTATIEVPVIYIKDKQAFIRAKGIMRLLGPAVEAVKKLSDKYILFHIIDLDLKKGSTANFDIYDKLTYFTHIEVECEDGKAMGKLAKMNARVALRLPTPLRLENLNKKLLVGIVEDQEADLSFVNDVIIAVDDEKKAKEITKKCVKEKKRIMVYEGKIYEELCKIADIWAVILAQP